MEVTAAAFGRILRYPELLRFLPVSSGTSNRDLIINSRYSVTCALETGSKSSGETMMKIGKLEIYSRLLSFF